MKAARGSLLFMKFTRRSGRSFVLFILLKCGSDVYFIVINEGKAAFLRNENEFPCCSWTMHKSSFVYLIYENKQGINQQHWCVPDSAALLSLQWHPKSSTCTLLFLSLKQIPCIGWNRGTVRDLNKGYQSQRWCLNIFKGQIRWEWRVLQEWMFKHFFHSAAHPLGCLSFSLFHNSSQLL